MFFVVVSIVIFVENLYWTGISILLLFLIMLVITYLGIPRKIIVTDTEMVLYNLGFKRVIKRDNGLRARIFTVDDKDGLWRKFARHIQRENEIQMNGYNRN